MYPRSRTKASLPSFRTKRYSPHNLVLEHDVPRGRFELRRQGHRRALVRFRTVDPFAARPYMDAGVEVVSY